MRTRSQDLPDYVTLKKQDGREFSNINAYVSKKKIFIMDGELLIESGDTIERSMSNGGVETYEVVDPGFYEKADPTPAHYQMEVRKLGVPKARDKIRQVTYNVSGSNARINQNSVDKSINVVASDPGVSAKLEELRQELSELVEDDNQRADPLSLVGAIEDQFASDSPNRAAVDALLKALPAVGNVASIGSFLLSCLA